MTKTLKQIKLGNNNYTYIQNEDGSTNVNGYKFQVTEEIREYFANFGGFMRDMFQPMQKDDIVQVVILFIEIPIKGQLAGVYFKSIDDDKSNHNLTSAGKFIEVVKKKLTDGNIEYEKINSLEEVFSHPEYDLNIFLEEYINPQSTNDTGFYINGRMVNFGDTLTTKSAEKADEIIAQIIDANEENKKYEGIQLSRVNLEVNEPNPFGIDVKLTFYDKKGKHYNSNHEFILEELGRMPTEKEYNDIVDKENLEILMYEAFSLNEKLKNRAKRSESGEVCREYRDKRIKEMINSHEREMNEGESYQMSMYISYTFLNRLIEKDLLQFPND